MVPDESLVMMAVIVVSGSGCSRFGRKGTLLFVSRLEYEPDNAGNDHKNC
jgi:hypothetical protein